MLKESGKNGRSSDKQTDITSRFGFSKWTDSLREKIDTVETRLNARIDEVTTRLDATHTKIDAVEAKLSEKIDAARIELKQGIEKVDKTVDLTNRKFSIVSEGLMTSQAEIRELQSVNNLL